MCKCLPRLVLGGSTCRLSIWTFSASEHSLAWIPIAQWLKQFHRSTYLRVNNCMRHCKVLLSLTQSSFHPAHISTPKWAYNVCCHYRCKALIKHIAITSCQLLIIWMSERVITWQQCSSRGLEPATLQLWVLCCDYR